MVILIWNANRHITSGMSFADNRITRERSMPLKFYNNSPDKSKIAGGWHYCNELAYQKVFQSIIVVGSRYNLLLLQFSFLMINIHLNSCHLLSIGWQCTPRQVLSPPSQLSWVLIGTNWKLSHHHLSGRCLYLYYIIKSVD